MLQSNCAILPPLMGTFTSPPKLHFLLPLHWVEVLSPCTQLSAPGPMCSASSPAVAETLPVLLAESAPSTYRCICSTLTHSRFHPSSSPLCLLCFIDVFLSSFFFQYADMMLYLPSLTTNPLLTLIFPFHVTPSPFTQNYLKEHLVCNFSPFILSSTHLDEDFLFIYSTAPVRVANEPCMLHPIDISHPLSSSWQWASL